MAEDQSRTTIYAKFIDSPTFYLVCLDTKGYYTYVNPAFAQKFSFISNTFIGLHHDRTICADDVELSHQVIENCLSYPDHNFTLRIRKPNAEGSMNWSHWEVSAIKEEQGDISGVLCVGYDITDNEHAQREAVQNVQKLDNIIEHISDGFMVLDSNWRFVKINRVLEKKMGIDRAQILGKQFWDFFPESAAASYPAAYRKAMQEKVTVCFNDYDPVFNIWYEITAYPHAEGLTVLFRDVTEKKLIEDLINQSKNKLSAILNSTADINILIDPEFKVVSFNKQAYDNMRIFYEGKQLEVGQNILEYVLPGTEEKFIENFKSALRGKPAEEKIKLFFKPGMALWFLSRYFPVYDADNKIMGVSFNSTNIDRQQRQFEKLEEIASLYSHDIRRPVATILGITQLINEKELSYENQEWFRYLRKTTLELDRVIHRIVRKTSEIN